MPNFMANLAEKAESGALNDIKAPFVQVLLDVVEDMRISAQALRLYLVMTAISKGFPSCWPPQSLLAAKLGVSERSVRQYLKELEKHGLIEIEHRGQPGQNLVNLYHLKKLVSGKQVERKKTSAATGRKSPAIAEIFCEEERKKTSEVIHESVIHESIDLNTPVKAATDVESVEEVCVPKTSVDKIITQEREQEQSSVTLIEQQLKLAGVSATRAKKAAHELAARGRTSRYVEQWQRWIAARNYIQNPAAYLLSRIQENTDVPRENRATGNRLSSWSEALSMQEQFEREDVVTPSVSGEVAASEAPTPVPAQYPALKLVVDNTARPPVRRAQDPWDDYEDELRLVVDNYLSCEVSSAESGLLDGPDVVNRTTFAVPAPLEELPQERHEAKDISVMSSQRTLSNVEQRKGQPSSAPKIDLRLKELMAQRDERIKRVKRLEVVGDTLYVAFWFRHEAETGVGKNWLADAKWFYPEVSKVELV